MVPNKLAKRVLRCLVAGLVACAFYLLTVPLYGWCWHLLHGNFISYENWEVPVPKGYFVRNLEDGPTQKPQYGPTMWKLTLGAPILKVPSAHFSFYNRSPLQPFSFERDYSRFKAGLIRSDTDYGFQLKSEGMATVGNNVGHCLEFVRAKDASELLVHCAIENNVVLVFYDGDARYTQDFFTMLREMTLQKSGDRKL